MKSNNREGFEVEEPLDQLTAGLVAAIKKHIERWGPERVGLTTSLIFLLDTNRGKLPFPCFLKGLEKALLDLEGQSWDAENSKHRDIAIESLKAVVAEFCLEKKEKIPRYFEIEPDPEIRKALSTVSTGVQMAKGSAPPPPFSRKIRRDSGFRIRAAGINAESPPGQKKSA